MQCHAVIPGIVKHTLLLSFILIKTLTKPLNGKVPKKFDQLPNKTAEYYPNLWGNVGTSSAIHIKDNIL